MSTTIHAPNKVASTSGKPTRRLANRTRTKSSARSNETPVDQNSDKQPANIQQHEANTDAMDSMDDAQKNRPSATSPVSREYRTERSPGI